MRSLSRRQAIVGTLAAAALPASASARIVDPHVAWVDEWAELEQISWGIDPAPDALLTEIDRLSDLIMDTPAITPEGMLAKIRLVKESYLDDGADDQPALLIRQLEAFIGAQA